MESCPQGVKNYLKPFFIFSKAKLRLAIFFVFTSAVIRWAGYAI